MLKQRLLIGRASGLRSLFGGAISADPSPIVSTGIFHIEEVPIFLCPPSHAGFYYIVCNYEGG